MKIYIDGKHVKTVPQKYSVLGDLTLFFDDLSRKRLTVDEREKLDRALSWFNYKSSLNKSNAERIISDMLGDDTPIEAVQVNLRDGKQYYMLRTQKKMEVKVPHSVFEAFSPKSVIFRNY